MACQGLVYLVLKGSQHLLHLHVAGQGPEPLQLHGELRGSWHLLQGLQGPVYLTVACQGSQRILQILQGLLPVTGQGLEYLHEDFQGSLCLLQGLQGPVLTRGVSTYIGTTPPLIFSSSPGVGGRCL